MARRPTAAADACFSRPTTAGATSPNGSASPPTPTTSRPRPSRGPTRHADATWWVCTDPSSTTADTGGGQVPHSSKVSSGPSRSPAVRGLSVIDLQQLIDSADEHARVDHEAHQRVRRLGEISRTSSSSSRPARRSSSSRASTPPRSREYRFSCPSGSCRTGTPLQRSRRRRRSYQDRSTSHRHRHPRSLGPWGPPSGPMPT